MKDGAIWGAEANYMDPGVKHMVAHLQRAALARLPALRNSPCISIAPPFKEISQKEPSFLYSQINCSTRAGCPQKPLTTAILGGI